MFDLKYFYRKFLVDYHFWGNDFAMIKNFWQKKCWWKFLLLYDSRGNDKTFSTKKILDENF